MLDYIYYVLLVLFLIRFFFFFCFFLGPNLQHMEVSRPGVESELQLPTYAKPQQCQIEATSVTCETCGNAGSLTH